MASTRTSSGSTTASSQQTLRSSRPRTSAPGGSGHGVGALRCEGAGAVSPMSKDAARKIALKVFRDVTSATTDDARKLAAAVLMLVDGKLPR